MEQQQIKKEKWSFVFGVLSLVLIWVPFVSALFALLAISKGYPRDIRQRKKGKKGVVFACISLYVQTAFLVLVFYIAQTETFSDAVQKEQRDEQSFNQTKQQIYAFPLETKQRFTPDTVKFKEIGYQVPFFAHLSEEVLMGDMPYRVYQLETGVTVSIVAESLPFKMTLLEYQEWSKKNRKYAAEKENLHTVGLIEWRETVQREKGVSIHQRTFIKNQTAYLFTYASTPKKYKDYLPVYQMMTRSVAHTHN